MKNVKLIETTLDELGGVEPQPGSKVTYQGVTYHVIEITPPAEKPPSKWRRPAKPVTPKWRLLVERLMDESNQAEH